MCRLRSRCFIVAPLRLTLAAIDDRHQVHKELGILTHRGVERPGRTMVLQGAEERPLEPRKDTLLYLFRFEVIEESSELVAGGGVDVLGRVAGERSVKALAYEIRGRGPQGAFDVVQSRALGSQPTRARS